MHYCTLIASLWEHLAFKILGLHGENNRKGAGGQRSWTRFFLAVCLVFHNSESIFEDYFIGKLTSTVKVQICSTLDLRHSIFSFKTIFATLTPK